MDWQTFGYMLRNARKRRALTVTALAQRLGVTHAAVSQWEHGRYRPSKNHLAQLREEFPELRQELSVPTVSEFSQPQGRPQVGVTP